LCEGTVMTLAIRVLIGLIAGFLFGLAIAGSSSTAAGMTLKVVGPIGTLFVNLIRLTVVPLVFSMVVASVTAMISSGGAGRTGIYAAAIMVGLLLLASIGSVLVVEPIFAHISIDQDAAL